MQNNSAALTKYHRGDLLVEIVEEKQLLALRGYYLRVLCHQVVQRAGACCADWGASVSTGSGVTQIAPDFCEPIAKNEGRQVLPFGCPCQMSHEISADTQATSEARSALMLLCRKVFLGVSLFLVKVLTFGKLVICHRIHAFAHSSLMRC